MNRVGLLFLTIFAAVLVLVSCLPPTALTKSDLTNYATSGQATGACLNCHTSNYGFTGVAAVNQTKYMSSGHANGLREPLGAGYATNSVDQDSGSCSKCHTTDGFVSWTGHPAATTISATTVPPAIANASITVSPNQVSCFACHNPHSNWNMDLRVNMAVGIGSGMSGVGPTASTFSSNVFSGGEGNLCANCHQDRTDNTKRTSIFAPMAASAIYTPVLGVVAAGGSPHHGVQSDFLMAKDSAGNEGGAVSTGYVPSGSFGTSHYSSNFKSSSTGTNDSCVICHVSLNTQYPTGQVSSHAMYLTSTATGDNVAVCAVCHVSGGTTVSHNANTGTTSFQTFVSSSLLANIDSAKKTLLGFFGTPAYFFNYTTSGTSPNPVTNISENYGGQDTRTLVANGAVQGGNNTVSSLSASGLPTTKFVPTSGQYTAGATWQWKKDWDFTSPVYMTVKEQQALWNFKVFSEDRSGGIHNPKYAAELLYDAIKLINSDTGAGGVRAGPLVSDLPNPWVSWP